MVSEDREDDLREDVRALLKVDALMLPVWKRIVGVLPPGPETDAALKAIEEAERRLADRSESLRKTIEDAKSELADIDPAPQGGILESNA